MRKTTSTNTINKKQLEADCGMAYAIALLSGRWKLSILGFLRGREKLRYGAFRKLMPDITERMLITQLKALEQDGLITRFAYPEVPPRVEYALSAKGKSLKKVLDAMSAWGERHNSKPVRAARGSEARRLP
jgi:DNA-binding HxlR family transcriptional regulator